MSTLNAPGPPPDDRLEAAIRDLASRQHGVATLQQLAAAGIPRPVVDRCARRGRFRRLHAGVYLVVPVMLPLSRLLAAVLACGDCLVSHSSAAWLHGLVAPHAPGDPVHITVPQAARRGRRKGIEVHRSDVAADQATVVEGIGVTSVSRTLLDLAGTATDRDIRAILDAAMRRDPALPAQLRTLARAHVRRAGVARLLALLGGNAGDGPLRSELERRFAALLRAAGAPMPHLNTRLHGYEVDCYWPDARLVVELDGHAFHSSARAFASDRRKGIVLAAAGVEVVRLSWHQITRDEGKTLFQLGLLLGRRLGR